MIRKFLDSAAWLFVFDESTLTPFERSYCRETLRRHFSEVAWTALWVGVAFNLGALLGLDRLLLDEGTRASLVPFHVGQLIALLGYAAVRRRFPDAIRVWMILNILAITASSAITVRQSIAVTGIFSATLGTAFLAFACTTLMFIPAERRILLGTAVAYVILAAVTSLETEAGRRWLPIAGLAIGGAVIFHTVKSVLFCRTSLFDARAKLLMAPAPLVLRSAATGRPLEELFAPARRTCACVSITWQNYDSMAKALPAERLAELLDSYYHRCDLQLAAGIPDDAYFIDVLCDEMFVVIFDTAEDRDTEAGAAAFRRAYHFARGLIEDADAGRIGGDVQLNAGISFGDVLVGIVGPRGHRKATGLGETPGRAARLKAAAGTLRTALGDGNRMVIDGKGLGALGSTDGICAYHLAPGTKLRDLAEATLHYWQTDRRREAA